MMQTCSYHLPRTCISERSVLNLNSLPIVLCVGIMVKIKDVKRKVTKLFHYPQDDQPAYKEGPKPHMNVQAMTGEDLESERERLKDFDFGFKADPEEKQHNGTNSVQDASKQNNVSFPKDRNCSSELSFLGQGSILNVSNSQPQNDQKSSRSQNANMSFTEPNQKLESPQYRTVYRCPRQLAQ